MRRQKELFHYHSHPIHCLILFYKYIRIDQHEIAKLRQFREGEREHIVSMFEKLECLLVVGEVDEVPSNALGCVFSLEDK